MRIDSSHRPWMVATLIILGSVAITFVGSISVSTRRLHGGDLAGISYGIAGYGLMLYAALLGLRKKVPVWRIGRAQTWMRGHLWLGMLSLPMILFHCAFTWRGTLATLLMVLLFITVGTGILGAALQHFIPLFMTNAVPLETIYDEIPHVRQQLCDEADTVAASISGSVATRHAAVDGIDPEIRGRFAVIYANSIVPVLQDSKKAGAGSPSEDLDPIFDSLRKMFPSDAHFLLQDLESLCEEAAQLRKLRRIHFWLNGWLLVHVPLSIALLVLGAVHAVIALRY